MTMEWDRDKCLELIDAYEKSPQLWNPQNGLYYNKRQKNDAWINIAHKFECSVDETKKKMESMLSSFRREKAKGKKIVGTGKAAQEVYISKWFAFKNMLFLLDREGPRIRMNSPDTVVPPGNDTEELQMPSDDELDEEVVATPPTVIKLGKRRKTEATEEQRVEEAFNVLKRAVTRVGTGSSPSQSQNDDCSIYGQHIANKMRTYNCRTKALVQYHMNNILFKADMGQYDGTLSPSSPSSSNMLSNIFQPTITMLTDPIHTSSNESQAESESIRINNFCKDEFL